MSENKNRLIAGTFCLLLFLTPALAHSRILTVRSVIKKMEQALSNLQDYTASFQLLNKLANNTYSTSGKIFYKKPFFLRVRSNDGSQIVSNGKKLWIFVPKYTIVAEQELIRSDKKYNMLLSTSGKSFRHMRRDYSFRFAPRGKTDSNYYIFDLKPRVTKVGFKKIRLWVSKKTYFISRVVSETVNGRKINITFTGITPNRKKPLSKGLFYFGMPDKNVQTIKNTILPTEYMRKRR